MASSQQDIPTLANNSCVTKTHRHSHERRDHLPQNQATTDETKRIHAGTPVIPGRTVRRYLSRQISDDNDVGTSPGGSIDLRPSVPSTRSANIYDLSRLEPAPPSQIANTCARRARHASTLLQSPARAGHAARLRQIFEDASRANDAAQTAGGDLYPQLPDSPRKTSPRLLHSRILQQHSPCSSLDRRRKTLSLPTDLITAFSQPDQLQKNLSQQSELISGSWSDDSSYFITDSRGHASTLVLSPRERIHEWLHDISLSFADTTDETVTSNSDDELGLYRLKQISITTQQTQMVDDATNTKGAELTEPCVSPYSGLDPFTCDSDDSSIAPLFKPWHASDPSSSSYFGNVTKLHFPNVYNQVST